jgi:hypothetical protein
MKVCAGFTNFLILPMCHLLVLMEHNLHPFMLTSLAHEHVH